MSEDEKSRIDVPPVLRLAASILGNSGPAAAAQFLERIRAIELEDGANRTASQPRQLSHGYKLTKKSVTKLVKQICDVTSLKGSYEFSYIPDKRIENKMVLGFLRITDERANQQLPAFTVYASDDWHGVRDQIYYIASVFSDLQLRGTKRTFDMLYNCLDNATVRAIDSVILVVSKAEAVTLTSEIDKYIIRDLWDISLDKRSVLKYLPTGKSIYFCKVTRREYHDFIGRSEFGIIGDNPHLSESVRRLGLDRGSYKIHIDHHTHDVLVGNNW